MTHLKALQKLVFHEYRKNGYEEMWNRARELLKPEGLENIVDMAELFLVITEVCEAGEELRKSPVDEHVLGTELADTHIRLLNYASRKKINTQELIIEKHAKNMKRSRLHGRRI